MIHSYHGVLHTLRCLLQLLVGTYRPRLQSLLLLLNTRQAAYADGPRGYYQHAGESASGQLARISCRWLIA